MKYLKNFLELITENKTEALRKKYVSLLSDKFDIDLQKANALFDDLSEMEDPTLNKVYIQWILNNSINNFDNFKKLNNFIKEDLYKWKEYLNIYHKVKDKLPIESKNIQRLSIKDLTDIALQYKEKEQEIGTKNEVLDKKYKINENEEYLVYMFKTATKEDFKFYQLVSTNTEWCTRPNYSIFKGYIEEDPLFVFINKNNRSEKYQFHEQSGQFMDKDDEEINYNLLIYFIKLISKYLPEGFVMEIKIDNSYGFINKQGNIIKELKWVGPFNEGITKAQFQDNSYGFINKKGNIIAKGFKNVGSFKEDFAWVIFQDNSFGFINKRGNIYEEDQKTLINKNDPRLEVIQIYPEKFIQ